MSTLTSLRRLLSVACVSAFAVALMLGAASSAHAETTETCVFTGDMAAGPGPMRPVQKVSSVQSGAPLLDTGVYMFGTAATQGGPGAACAGATAAGPFAALGNITSSGSYSNVVCGTGVFSSRDANTAFDAVSEPLGTAPDFTSADYDILIVAGQGPLVWNSASFANGDVAPRAPLKPRGGGWVSIEDTTLGENTFTLTVNGQQIASVPIVATACTLSTSNFWTEFRIAGFFTVTTAGGGLPQV